CAPPHPPGGLCRAARGADASFLGGCDAKSSLGDGLAFPGAGTAATLSEANTETGRGRRTVPGRSKLRPVPGIADWADHVRLFSQSHQEQSAAGGLTRTGRRSFLECACRHEARAVARERNSSKQEQ